MLGSPDLPPAIANEAEPLNGRSQEERGNEEKV